MAVRDRHEFDVMVWVGGMSARAMRRITADVCRLGLCLLRVYVCYAMYFVLSSCSLRFCSSCALSNACLFVVLSD